MKRKLFPVIALVILLSVFFSCASANAEVQDFEFTRENFPVIDGSTSCVPLGKSLAAVLLPDEEDTDELIDFHKTTQSFRNLLSGACDIIISGQPEAAVFEELEDAGFEYKIKPFATDALIFVVNAENPVSDLTTQQIRDIYSGKITNWKEVGGNDAPIAAFQRNPGAGSQALMLKLVMGSTPMTDPVEGFVATEMGMLMEAVKNYDNSANAIGYSVYYYANDMKKASGLKILSVDGVAPSAETIASGEYPHLNPYYTAVPEDLPENAPAAVLYSWITSEDGCSLLTSLGYVPAEADDAIAFRVKSDLSKYAGEENASVFSRLTAERIEDFSPCDDYGAIYPFHGTAFFESYDDYTYNAGYYDGLFDSSGRIVADPVYADIYLASYWDPGSDRSVSMPIWILKKADGKILSVTDGWEDIEDNSKYAIASVKGNFSTECVYDSVHSTNGAVVAVKDKNGTDFTVFDTSGNILLTDKDIEFADRMVPGLNQYSVNKLGNAYSIKLSDGYYIFDTNGKITAGPFEYIGEFSDEYNAVRYSESNGYTITDRYGQPAVEGSFDSISPFQSGIGVLCRDGNVNFVDKDFSVICSLPGEYGSAYDFGYMADGKYYDLSGNRIFSDEDQEQWCQLLSTGIFYKSNSLGVTLYSYPEDTHMFFGGYSYAYMPYAYMSQTDLPFILLDGQNERRNWETLVCDLDLNRLFKTDGHVSAVENSLTGEAYLVVNEKGICTLYDIDMEKTAEFTVNGDYPEISIYGNTMIVSDSESVTAYSIDDGSVFFSYPVSKLN